ncbi:uncharacterized protein LOC120075923 [Benincasa hispida]|uniref:uncharacterized protein LOC120075923 n=1 Tax=Benincasa hispida TaxID=102211 RepID=UPI001900B08C|nr:uncharacterized protein LOC120075923 [Benincasa hispida]
MVKMKKFQVKLENLKLLGYGKENERIAIEIKWKGPQRHSLLPVPFYAKSPLQTNRTTAQRVLSNHHQTVQWNHEFHSMCEFEFPHDDASSIPFWDTKFYVLLEEEPTKSKTKSSVLGKASLNLAEMLSAMETKMERNVPIVLKDSAGAAPHHATISVCVNFVEVRDGPDPIQQEDKEGFLKTLKDLTSFKKKNREKGKVISSDGENRGLGDSTTGEEDGDHKQGKSLTKKRRLSFSFRHSRRKVEPWLEKTNTAVNDGVTVDRQRHDNGASVFNVAPISTTSQMEKAESTEFSLETNIQYKEASGGRWETREIVSRDGKLKLKTEVFFGSFDQRSEKAGGESACTAIVAVIAHWLHSNYGVMPTQLELDNLIMEGSSEWQKLCNNECYSNSFPNKHFDLETVVQADVGPITVSAENSFVGFFSPEKFNCLTEAMSFEQIWNEVNTKTFSNYESRIYIVSWNDHFFVLKMDENACYIIDSLGERLFEGCNQAYILKFDSSSLMFENQEKGEVGELVCRGKECCREFFERFLAAITIEELEEEQKKLGSCNFIPHQRLQIDFHFSSPVASSSSSSTSPSSLFFDQDSA